MRIQSVKLENFRCFKDEMVDFSRYTAIIGPNNNGKSTVLAAIDIFFKTSQSKTPLALTDFNDPALPLRISVKFVDLNSDAAEQFKHYYRHSELEFYIQATVSGGSVSASVHGQRLGLRAFAGFFSAQSAVEKKEAYRELRKTFPDLASLPASASVDAHSAALASFEEFHPESLEPIESSDLAFGAAGIAFKLRRFIEWIYVPAVKDAGEENQEAKNNAFGSLINRIIRASVRVEERLDSVRTVAKEQIAELVSDYDGAVRSLEAIIDDEFRQITSTDSHIHLNWSEISDKNIELQMPTIRSLISDSSFKGDITRFGHGLQRNYLLTLIRLSAQYQADGPTSAIIAIEEPELYQHPPQARHLYSSLRKMSERDQIITTTHSPYFISARDFEDVRVVRKNKTEHSRISKWTQEDHRRTISIAKNEKPIGSKATLASIESFIQPELSEAFFCQRLVLVEGPEDRALITGMLTQHGQFADFNRSGGHIVPANGKPNFVNMIAIARGLCIPHLAIYDADSDCKPGDVEKTKQLNRLLARLLYVDEAKFEWPSHDIFAGGAIVWSKNIQESIAADYSDWHGTVLEICESFGWTVDRLRKNPAVLAAALDRAYALGPLQTGTNLVDVVMRFVTGDS